MTPADLALIERLGRALSPQPPTALGVAVSGGGDSMALLHLLADWAAGSGCRLAAVTVDHRLRPEAAEEAAMVGRACAGLGLPHDILHWHWDGQGNLSDAARRGRYALMADWARGRGIGAVALGHTLDDQAETVLLRLARGSGVDGLSGMAARRAADGILWLRPLLDVRRAALRDFLTARGIGWAEDPSNDNPAYDRVKARTALAALAPLGIDAEGLAETAARLAMARRALEEVTLRIARDGARVEAGDVVFDRAALDEAPQEIRLRLIAHALRWIVSADYRPRLAPLAEAVAAALAGGRRTLAGCLISGTADSVRISREYRAVRDSRCPTDRLWDRRWALSGPDSGGIPEGLELRALGEDGLAACPDWRQTGLPRDSLLATPAVWRGAELVAAPLAGRPGDWTAELAPDGCRAGPDDPGGFLQKILSH
ncbi:tRNA lysidine(34) synthetase TilS [Acidimangrovimonas pyrenivorans]|uniref:tRNA(Ile)-lysidine synthase n=1 Tax=Acidimangrovimonas pyrenivorans TaxID=2030798 RepID=A0ABV7AB01_9RHOB